VTRGGKKTWILVLRGVVVVALVAGFALLLRGLDGRALADAIGQANIGIVVAAAALSFVLIGWKALRLHVLLRPVAAVPVRRLYRYTFLSYAASTLLPARAGEVLRVWLLVKRDAVPVRAAAVVAAAEKIFEAIGMLAVVAPLPWMLPDLPAWVGRAMAVLAAVGGAALVLGWLLLRWGRGRARLRLYVDGLEVLRRPRDLLLTLLLSLVMWATDLLALHLVLVGLHVDAPLGASLLTLLAINVAIALPAAPAHLGSFEFGAVLALHMVGIGREQALAFALVYHAMQALPLAVIGLVEMRFITSTLAAADRGEPGPARPA
jgi:uncharacterized membrane protein YbhN (UPF0104 family)